MSEPPTLLPYLQVDASTYEAGEVEVPPVPVKSWPTREGPSSASVATPQVAVIPSAVDPAPPRVSRRAPRVRDLLQRIRARHNEFWDLLLGPYSRSGWAGSLGMHVVAVVCLGLLLVPAERKEPPRIITGGVDDDGAGQVGDSLADIDIELPQPTPVESAAALVATGGSQGDVLQGVSAAFGPPAGSGSGTGAGAGDAVGDEIAGRVQAAGGRGGRLQISIGWSDRNDLDLHLLTPTGQHVYYATPETPDGGKLDVDMNVEGESSEPVENITWESRQPPDGTYTVAVHYFKRHIGGPTDPRFHVRLDLGGEVRVVSSKIKLREMLTVAQFSIVDGRLASLETNLAPASEEVMQLSAADSKRVENREQTASELLADAKATINPRLRAGKLRRLIERFRDTEAATAARELLEQLP